MDLHISTIVSINSSALEVACGPPGIGAKTFQENSESSFELLTVEATSPFVIVTL